MESSAPIRLSIAGIDVSVDCDHPKLTGLLKERFAPFLNEGHPPGGEFAVDIRVQPPQHVSSPTHELTFHTSSVHFDQPGYQGSIDVMGGRARLTLGTSLPLEDADYFLRVTYALLAFQAGGLMFHAAGIARSGRAYLFFGHSGSGKTTVSRNSPIGTVLNDDLVVLMPGESGWVAHGTPFWNPTQLPPTQESAPLKAMLRLVQDTEVYLEPMAAGRKLAELCASAPVISADPARNPALLQRCQALCEAVPVYRLHFLPDSSFWKVVEAI